MSDYEPNERGLAVTVEAQKQEAAPEVDALKGELKAIKDSLQEVADAMLSLVPDHLKPLIPADLGPAAKIKWFQNAEKTGVFAPAKVPETDTAKPGITPKSPDLSNLPAHARLAAGYGRK